jgi:hypothetical protein
MKLLYALVISIMLLSAAMASAEKVTLGPYVASFKLNESDKYTIKVNDPSIGKTVQVEPRRWNQRNSYSFDIIANDKTRSRVTIFEWANSTDATVSTDRLFQELLLKSLGYNNITGGYRTIDGREGFFMAAYGTPDLILGNKTFNTWYWIDKVDVPQAVVSYGKKKVTITGNLSADSVIALLDTIQINKS